MTTNSNQIEYLIAAGGHWKWTCPSCNTQHTSEADIRGTSVTCENCGNKGQIVADSIEDEEARRAEAMKTTPFFCPECLNYHDRDGDHDELPDDES